MRAGRPIQSRCETGTRDTNGRGTRRDCSERWYGEENPVYCKACEQSPAPYDRGVYLCRECTRVLVKVLANPSLGFARVLRVKSYGEACDLCGEYQDRRIIDHPEWGRICEVDVKEAAEIHRLQLS